MVPNNHFDVVFNYYETYDVFIQFPPNNIRTKSLKFLFHLKTVRCENIIPLIQSWRIN